MTLKTRKKVRKPHKTKAHTTLYPRIENDETGKIWVQATPAGKWKKVPLGRARILLSRFDRAVRYAQHVKN